MILPSLLRNLADLPDRATRLGDRPAAGGKPSNGLNPHKHEDAGDQLQKGKAAHFGEVTKSQVSNVSVAMVRLCEL